MAGNPAGKEYVTRLTEAENAELLQPVNGSGGFQSLLRRLKAQLSDDGTIVLSRDLAERLIRSAETYGSGGFQTRLQKLTRLIEAARELLESEEPSAEQTTEVEIETCDFSADDAWDNEVLQDISYAPDKLQSLIVSSRDWTVETILSQIRSGNIDLNPKFQRRNAWNDEKRSRLVESLIVGFPVPQLILAENPHRRKSYIVIDGKQRLLSVAGFAYPQDYHYWDRPSLRKLAWRVDLNGVSYDIMGSDPDYADELRALLNADVRCTFLSGYGSDDVLYDIFHRLNAGSVPLSTQELRQVLHKGPFADYLLDITSEIQPIHQVMGIDGPDPRFRDIEMILRFVGIVLLGNHYQGDLKAFLDSTMDTINANWATFCPRVEETYLAYKDAIERLLVVFPPGKVGRKCTDYEFESRLNKVLFEAEAFCFAQVPTNKLTAEQNEAFIAGFKRLCTEDAVFRASIEATTKTRERYRERFARLRDLVNEVYNASVPESLVEP